MPNFRKTEQELHTNFDKWMYVLQQLPNLQSRPQALQEKVFQKLFETAEIAKFTRDEQNGYESSLKYYRDLKNVIDTSFEEGKAEGEAVGIAVGRAVGIAAGRAVGRAEIARQMKAEGEPLEKIARFTGLAGEEIEKL
jgi:predicted transposase/invertase (TIGR01784 family)